MASGLSFANRIGGKAFRGYNRGLMGGMKGFGKFATSFLGSTALLGGGLAAITYDPTKNSFASHMGQEGLKIGSEAALDVAAWKTLGAAKWKTAGLLGRAGIVGAAGITAASILGFGAYSMVESSLEGAAEAYKKKMRSPTPIIQNERTMRSMRESLSLLGQGGRKHSMLGNEAQFMHNTVDNFGDMPYDIIPTSKRHKFGVNKPCEFIV